jgi:hypothetical protein
VLREIFGSKRDGVTGGGEICVMTNWIVCVSDSYWGDQLKGDEVDGACEGSMDTYGVWWGKLKVNA